MNSPILSQEEIDALLKGNTGARPQAEEDLQKLFSPFGSMVASRVNQSASCAACIDGPSVEAIDEDLSGVYLGDVYVAVLEFFAADLFLVVETRDASRLSRLLQADEIKAVLQIAQTWAQSLMQLMSETRPTAMHLQIKGPMVLKAHQIQTMPVVCGSHLVRYSVEWSGGSSDIGVLLPPQALAELSSRLKVVGTASASAPKSRSAGQRVRSARPAVEVQPLQFGELRRDESHSREQTMGLVRDVVIPVAAELGRTSITLGELMELQVGETISLQEAAGEPAKVYINGSCIARAEVTVLEDNFGVRILEIVPAAERVRTK